MPGKCCNRLLLIKPTEEDSQTLFIAEGLDYSKEFYVDFT
jgi:hypothetical protein